jgi:hypothetical protein
VGPGRVAATTADPWPVQGLGRGAGTAGEAVPCAHSSGPASLIGTCPAVFGKARRAGMPSEPRPITQQAIPAGFMLGRRWSARGRWRHA